MGRGLIGSYRITHAVKAAAQPGITEQLGERAQSAGKPAERLRANPRAPYRLLRTLVASPSWPTRATGCSPSGRSGRACGATQPDGSRAWALCAGAEYYQGAWMNLPHAAETGETAFAYAHGETFYQYLARHPETGHGFSRAIG